MAKGARKIVVAVDEGEESMYALSWCINNIVAVQDPPAEAEEEVRKDTLVLLYSRSPQLVYSAMDGSGYLFSSEIVASMEKYSQNVADSVMEKAKRVCGNGLGNFNVEAKVQTGDPRDVICEAVEKLGADMLVMGNHGYGFVKRALLGSVSNHCAQNIKCPVVIVKRPKH